MNGSNNTISFSLRDYKEQEIKKILVTVCEAMAERGYDPIIQLVGYILSEDPTYITNYRNARSLIRRIDRDELLHILVADYLKRLPGVSKGD